MTSCDPIVTRSHMPSREYHAQRQVLSSSSLSTYLKSPRLFGLWWRGEWQLEPSKSMRIGAALDGCLTGTFQEECIVRPAMDRRTKAGKALYEEFQAQSSGLTEISEDEYQTVQAMVEQVHRHPVAQGWIDDMTGCQECLFWREQDLDWKVRFDGELIGDHILEIKTHAPFQEERLHAQEWADTVVRYGYHRQAALYRHALALERRVDERQVTHSMLLVANEPPHDVHCLQLSEEFLAEGWREISEIIPDIRLRVALGDWDLSHTITTVEMPRWARRKKLRGNWAGF